MNTILYSYLIRTFIVTQINNLLTLTISMKLSMYLLLIDLIGLIKMVETVSTQNKASKKVFRPFGNLTTIEKCVTYKQRDTVSNTEFVKEVNTMYRSVIF
jgi:hypothetical protein